MRVHHEDERVTLWHGDALDVLRELPDASVDAVCTDPPDGLEFMGKDWDAPWKASSVGRGVRVESERAAEMTERGKGHTTPGGPFLAARVDSTRVAGKPFQDWCEAWATECLRGPAYCRTRSATRWHLIRHYRRTSTPVPLAVAS